MKRALFAFGFALAAFRCSTLAESAGGDSNLPSTGVGPFRKLKSGEVANAPYVYDDATADYRAPCALPLAGPSEDALFVVMSSQGHDVIARTHATDGRTFYGSTLDVGHHPLQVLASDQSWESPDLAHPSVLAVAGGVWLYYTSNGSVGLAKSADGLAFTKVSAPVLAADASGPIASASVAMLPDGSFDMMLAVSGAIFEATSADGVAWQRAAGPILSASGDSSTFDALAVSDPYLSPRTTAANRLQMRVLYTGHAQGDAGEVTAIGFAARYGTSGPLVRADGPVFSNGKNESAPSLLDVVIASPDAGTIDGTLLYVEQDQTSNGKSYRAIAAGFAPPTAALPTPDPFPSSP
jgi:hypothetical protein